MWSSVRFGKLMKALVLFWGCFTSVSNCDLLLKSAESQVSSVGWESWTRFWTPTSHLLGLEISETGVNREFFVWFSFEDWKHSTKRKKHFPNTLWIACISNLQMRPKRGKGNRGLITYVDLSSALFFFSLICFSSLTSDRAVLKSLWIFLDLHEPSDGHASANVTYAGFFFLGRKKGNCQNLNSPCCIDILPSTVAMRIENSIN